MLDETLIVSIIIYCIDMNITATFINLSQVCHRELWLHSNGIRMEHTSDVVADGELIGETTYPERTEKYTVIRTMTSKIRIQQSIK